MKKYKSIAFILIGVLFLLSLNACDNRVKNEVKPTSVECSTREKVETEAETKEYQNLKKKLLNNGNLTDEEYDGMESYIESLFYVSFDKYKKEADLLFDKFMKHNHNYALAIVTMPLVMNDRNKDKYCVEEYEKIMSVETLNWTLKRINEIESKVMKMDRNSKKFQKDMYGLLLYKEILYYRLGDQEQSEICKEEREKYYSLAYEKQSTK